MERDVFEFTDPGDPDNTMYATAHAHGVIFAISEEQAVDSYNQQVDCSVKLLGADVERLRDWLIKVTADAIRARASEGGTQR